MSDIEGTCQSCGSRNIVWHAPSPLWNRAIRREDGSDVWGILCPVCFARAYEATTGERPVWCLHPHDHQHGEPTP